VPDRRRLDQPRVYRRPGATTRHQTRASGSSDGRRPPESSVATNAALELATGEYIALLDHDDTLAPGALQRVGAQIAPDPDLDMIYSDEDIVDNNPIWCTSKPAGRRTRCKPRPTRAISASTGGRWFRKSPDFAPSSTAPQDVDMILRLVERTDRIAHTPEILHHRRIHADSTAGGDAKPCAYVAERNAIAGQLTQCGIEADVGTVRRASIGGASG
jgi:glycosyltransferase involved in cell wall biosynthesis